ncbi:MAG TPA: ankyrin repeat domain-containing protein [Noviherbaspirillum sp.]|jgi:ankyrin repeat protein|uniref:ankyrin repeat domain-containing protein n=1 Tax=Noviherbaspirillum sp. TaxID=1926288 RepID=UPI002F93F8EF
MRTSTAVATCSRPQAGRRRQLQRLAGLPLLALLPAAAMADAYVDYFRAIRIDDGPAVKKLLQRGFDPNTIEESRGDTGMIMALREEAMDVFRVLLAAPGTDLEAKAFNGDTALMIACFKGNLPAVQALLEKGAEVNRPGWTPLHYAAYSGNNDIVRLLLDKSAYIDAESPNKTTPMMMAAMAGKIYTVKLLLDEGADATLRNALGMNAIDFAVKHDHPDIAEGLTHRLRKAGKL